MCDGSCYVLTFVWATVPGYLVKHSILDGFVRVSMDEIYL